MSGELQRQTDLETILRPNQIVAGRYRVERLMAEGGMAAVWAGANLRTGKRVALKVILRSFAAIGEAAELFRREAMAASKVNHPNVVSIFDVIDHEGMTCIVMELLEGETLAAYLTRKGPLGLDEATTLLLPAMRGVAAANAMGVVHRDLKPGNIFLCGDNEGRLLACKVLDFGVSTMIERVGEKATATGLLSMFGTPAYMPPEAIECSPNIDRRVDVYGFGVLLFEMLTGQVPFPGEPGTELLARIVNDPPPKVTELRPDLPSTVVDIVDCALAKKPEDRFPDVEHFIRAIEDQLLPPVPVLRTLTPSAGSAFHGETMMLYSMAGESLRTTEKPATQGREQTLTVHLARTMRTLVFDLGRFLHRRAAISAAVAAFLILAAWFALPRSLLGPAPRDGRSPSLYPLVVPAQGPQVTPLPSPPSPPSLASPALSPAAARGTDVSKPTVGTAASLPTKHLESAESKPRRNRAPATQVRRPTLRAGRLLPSDF
ncbi:MAG TPA: serine/threonine-protein kinase [Polyangia bacterium]